MKYRDPLRIICPQCGGISDQPVAMLLALEAVCPTCGLSFRDNGVRMSDQLRAVGDWATTLEITIAVEGLDARLKFRDGDLGDATHLTPRHHLSDTIEVVEKVIARLPATEPPPCAETLVFRALRQLCPSIENPSKDLSLEEIGEAILRAQRTSARKKS